MLLWFANGWGARFAQAALPGGNVRVGFEDNLYCRKGILAKSNAEYVSRTAQIGEDLGRTVATPDDTRKLLGMGD